MRLPEVGDEFTMAFETSWNRTLSILNHYKGSVHTASRAIQALEALRYQMHEAQSQGQLNLCNIPVNVLY